MGAWVKTRRGYFLEGENNTQPMKPRMAAVTTIPTSARRGMRRVGGAGTTETAGAIEAPSGGGGARQARRDRTAGALRGRAAL